MEAFFVRWRSARQFREFELLADVEVGRCLWEALQASAGWSLWESGTLWKCPGCGDRTLRTEEFLEGLRRAEDHLRAQSAEPERDAALRWLETIAVRMLGCERDRVYLKDATTPCRFAGETFISRI
jgi:hypothetical protein